MKFTVDMISRKSGRLGSLTKSESIQLKTPLVMNYTKGGSIPYLAREIFDKITTEQQMIEVSVENTSTMSEAVKAYGKGISSFAGLDSVALTLVTLKDPAISNPSFHRRKSISILPYTGKVVITPEIYMEHIECYKPDLFHIMSDGETSESCAQKRLINAVERTLYFFDECIELYKKNSSLAESFLIASITGGYSPIYREEFIKALNSKESQHLIGGYFLDGFHNNGASATKLDDRKVEKVVEKCQELLPNEKLKMMLGAYSPSLILKLIQLGVDLFDNTFAYLATTRDAALTFNFNIDTKSSENAYEIRLSDSSFKDDFGPFLKNCSCLACKKHTRAYTHHLCNTKELQGPILLMIHNTHHYTEFFRAIRKSIADDTLPEMVELIEAQKKEHDAQVAANEHKSETENKNVDANETDLKRIRIDDKQ